LKSGWHSRIVLTAGENHYCYYELNILEISTVGLIGFNLAGSSLFLCSLLDSDKSRMVTLPFKMKKNWTQAKKAPFRRSRVGQT
jgi:hypothetical protein